MDKCNKCNILYLLYFYMSQLDSIKKDRKENIIKLSLFVRKNICSIGGKRLDDNETKCISNCLAYLTDEEKIGFFGNLPLFTMEAMGKNKYIKPYVSKLLCLYIKKEKQNLGTIKAIANQYKF